MRMRNLLILLGLGALLLVPDFAHASRGIYELSSPLERVVGSITGPVGRWIAIFAMASCGIYFIMNRDDMTGGMKLLLGVAFGTSFIAFAATIVDGLFSFSGAVL